MRTYNAAVIGTGRIGYLLGKDRKREQPASHTHALQAEKRVNIVAGCDTDREILQKWQTDNKKAMAYSDHCQLLRQETIDLAVISVSEDAHLEVTMDTIAAKPGIIILEKPVALCLSDAVKIHKQAHDYNVPILINHERRYSLDYNMVKKLLDQEYIGPVSSVYAGLWSAVKVYDREQEVTGAYSLLHDGTHLFDIARYLFGDVLEPPELNYVKYTSAEKTDSLQVDQLQVHFSTPECVINFELAGNKKYFGFDLDIRGQTGRIIIGNGYLKVYRRRESPYYENFYSLLPDNKIKRPQKTCYFSNMVRNAVAFLDGKEPVVSTLADGIRSLEVIEKIIVLINCL